MTRSVVLVGSSFSLCLLPLLVLRPFLPCHLHLYSQYPHPFVNSDIRHPFLLPLFLILCTGDVTACHVQTPMITFSCSVPIPKFDIFFTFYRTMIAFTFIFCQCDIVHLLNALIGDLENKSVFASYEEGSNGVNAALNACASALSSSSDNMHAFQSKRSGVLSRATSTCLSRRRPSVSHYRPFNRWRAIAHLPN